MTARFFVPYVERLENRMLLAVMADVMPLAVAQPEVAEAAATVSDQHADNELDVVVRSEDSATGHFLVVQFKNLDRPRAIGIVDGDVASTGLDGAARLRQPKNIESLELTISDDSGVQRPFLLVDLDRSGHVVGYRPISTKMDRSPDHNLTPGSVDQLSRLPDDMSHDMAAAANSTPLAGNSSQSHAMDVRSIDEIFARHGMPGMAAMPQYSSMTGHATMASEAPDRTEEIAGTESPSDHESMDDETSAVQMAMAMIEEPAVSDDIESEDVVELEMEDVEQVVAAFVGLVKRDLQPAFEPTHLIAVMSPMAEEAPPAKLASHEVLMSVARPITPPTAEPARVAEPDDPSTSSNSSISSGLLAVACAAGVFVLEQRASKTKVRNSTEANGH